VIARVSGDNEPSIALHRACGFTRVGVEREVGRKFGHWIDVAVLQRML
jgi:L-amino acid N-acyltransferase YncA